MRLFTIICVVTIVWMYAPALYGQAIPYTNYELLERAETTATGAVSEGYYVEGPAPWSWYSGTAEPPAPFWNANTTIVETFIPTGPPTFDAELVGTIPYVGTRTLQTHEEGNPDVVIGTMVWNLVGAAPIDFNATRAVVDEDDGVIKIRVGHPLSPEPVASYTFVEETGVFLNDGIVPVRDPNSPNDPTDSWLFASGWTHVQLLDGVDVNDPVALQANINTAPVVFGFTEGAWTGYYIPEPSTLILAALAFAGLRPLVERQSRRSRVSG